MTEQTETAIVPLESGGLVTAAHFQEFAGEGQEDLSGISMAFPRLHIVQAMSPERKSRKAQDGQISIRNVPGRDKDDPLILDSMTFSIAQFKTCFVKWRRLPDGKRDPNAKFPEWSIEPDENGDVPEQYRADCEWKDNPANPGERTPPAASETFLFLTVPIIGDEPTGWPVVMGFDGPSAKVARELVRKLRGVKIKGADGKPFAAPIWAPVVKLTLVENSNNKGQWFDPKFEIIGIVSDAYAAEARKGRETPRDAW